MIDREPPLLLDTHAAIWAAENARIAQPARNALQRAYATGTPRYVSAITAWEIGMLTARGRLSLPLRPQAWFERLLEAPGLYLAELSPAILILASFLPGTAPKDPADRILAATAREGGYRLITRDRELLSYAAEGHIQAIAC